MYPKISKQGLHWMGKRVHSYPIHPLTFCEYEIFTKVHVEIIASRNFFTRIITLVKGKIYKELFND